MTAAMQLHADLTDFAQWVCLTAEVVDDQCKLGQHEQQARQGGNVRLPAATGSPDFRHILHPTPHRWRVNQTGRCLFSAGAADSGPCRTGISSFDGTERPEFNRDRGCRNDSPTASSVSDAPRHRRPVPASVRAPSCCRPLWCRWHSRRGYRASRHCRRRGRSSPCNGCRE